jgi:hypothetical protein
MNKRNCIIAGAVVILAVAAAWMFGLFGGMDPAVAELQQMGAQMFDQNLSEAQRDQLRSDFRQRIGALSDDQRRAFFDASRVQWQARTEQRMNEFFTLSAADQQKRLDDIINRMQQPRQDRGQDRGGRNGARRDGARGGWGNMTEAQRDERSKRRLDQTSPKMRAQFTEFRRRLEERAKQRGINDLPGWGFPGRGSRA